MLTIHALAFVSPKGSSLGFYRLQLPNVVELLDCREPQSGFIAFPDVSPAPPSGPIRFYSRSRDPESPNDTVVWHLPKLVVGAADGDELAVTLEPSGEIERPWGVIGVLLDEPLCLWWEQVQLGMSVYPKESDEDR